MVDTVDDGREGPTEDGVLGMGGASEGTKFERTRVGGLFGGPSVRSIAVAGRAGGGPGDGKVGARALDIPGDAVCALLGGAGGAAGLAASGGA